MPDLSPTTFKPVLKKLIKSPEEFSTADIVLALDHVVTPGAALPEQVGAFLTGLAVARVELRKEIVIAAAEFLFSRSVPAIVFNADKDFIVDIVGTGGDLHNTFNVSTTAAIVAAGAGVRVIKVRKKIASMLGYSSYPNPGVAWESSVDFILRLSRPPPIPWVRIRTAAGGSPHPDSRHPFHFSSRVELPPIARQLGPSEARAALSHALQRPWPTTQPYAPSRHAPRCRRARPRPALRRGPQSRGRETCVCGMRGRKSRRDFLRGRHALVGTARRWERARADVTSC